VKSNTVISKVELIAVYEKNPSLYDVIERVPL